MYEIDWFGYVMHVVCSCQWSNLLDITSIMWFKHVLNFRQCFPLCLGHNETHIENAQQRTCAIENADVYGAQIHGHPWIKFNTNETNGIGGRNCNARTKSTIFLWKYFGIHDKWNLNGLAIEKKDWNKWLNIFSK